MLQYGFVLTIIMGILQFRSKFYLIFDVCSDSENDSYVTIITGVLAQRYAIASLHYSRPITTTVLSVMYFYGTAKLHLSHSFFLSLISQKASQFVKLQKAKIQDTAWQRGARKLRKFLRSSARCDTHLGEQRIHQIQSSDLLLMEYSIGFVIDSHSDSSGSLTRANANASKHSLYYTTDPSQYSYV